MEALRIEKVIEFMTGTLYAVGVGPGDPELMTLKAARIIRECQVIAIPHDDPIQCTAYQIAMRAVPEMKEKPVICVKMPMTKDPDILEQAHKDGTEILIRELEKGYDVALLTLGDTTVYASSMYLVQRLEKQGYETKLISGIPSFCAAAAELGISLGEQAEEIHILPGSYGIQAALALSGVKVIMKSGKAYPKVVEQLRENQLPGLYGRKLYHGEPEAVSWGGTFSRKGRILYVDDCKRFSKGGRGQMINFVGAGSGAADLITVRGAKLLGEADVIIYAGSLVNPELLSYAKRDCQIYNSAHMTLEEVIDVMKEAEKDGQMTVRLHTGDPSLYGAIREQMDQFKRTGNPIYSMPRSQLFLRRGGGSWYGIYTAGYYPERSDHPYGRENACSREGEHRLFRVSRRNDGGIFKYRNAKEIVGRVDERRISGGYSGGYRL